MKVQEKKQPPASETHPLGAADSEYGKMARISQQTRGLVEDVKSWVELKMTLTQMDVEARIDSRINQAVVGAAVGALGFLGLSFGLVAAALGIGAWLGHDAWGFLIVAGLLFLVTVILLALKPRIVKITPQGGRTTGSDG